MGVDVKSNSRAMFGRRVIKSSAKEITVNNVVDEVQAAMNVHESNRGEIEYLWNYRNGNQPILHRVKKNRPEICNKVVENHANEIVAFKTGYLVGEPIQYVGRKKGKGVTKKIGTLNDFMLLENKSAKDREIVEWQMICGVGYRIVLPRKGNAEDHAPFEMYTLDPRDTFVVYSTDIGSKPLFAVKYSVDGTNNVKTFSVYTESTYFLIKDNTLLEARPHAMGAIPIIEYPADSARLGSFEIVLPLLDAINAIESNRVDGIEQFIQAFTKFVNCDISAEDFEKLRELGGIKVKSQDGQPADVDIVSSELNQTQSQTLKDDAYQMVLTICGIPNRNGGSSTSDTGQAVLLRDGWSLAEARAKDSENLFRPSEMEMLRLVLKICSELSGLDISLSDIEIKFTRRNYDNIQSKSQVLVSMLGQPKIHPKLAFEHCGMFSDPEAAYDISDKYYREQLAKWEVEHQKTLNEGDNDNGDGDLHES